MPAPAAARLLLVLGSLCAVGGAPSKEVTADVLVYGGSAAGCVAAIAASRSGARSVTVTTPYGHVGGMTTGGIMHADGGNSTVIHGITREYFERVLGHYPRPTPTPTRPGHRGSYSYACRASRCIEQNDVPGNKTAKAKCDSACKPLAENEWLAVTFLSKLSADNRTLTVSLPAGQKTSFIKKSEKLSEQLPKSAVQVIEDGQVLKLARPAVVVDQTYFLIELEAAAVVASPRHSLLPPAPKAGAPGCQDPDHPGCWLYESHLAEQVLEEMLAEANVSIVRNLVGLSGATKAGALLESVIAEDGTTLRAKVWIDGSYEGDLAYAGAADMVWGRESKAQYGEHGAGRRPVSLSYKTVDPYWPDGSVIPHVYTEPSPVTIGQADDRIEVYDFRLCVTNSPGNRVPFTKPASYNASEWEFWRRLVKDKPPSNLREAGLGCLGPIPNNYSDCGTEACVKCDMLGMTHGTDMLNGAWGYPNGTTEQRTAIREAHIHYTLGLLWFWQTDSSTGAALHEEMSALGLCTDEYVGDSGYANDPPHWPYQLYVREARRLVGDYVWTEAVVSDEMQKRSVGLGAYSFDCHWVTLYVEHNVTHGEKPFIAAEGRVNENRQEQDVGGVIQAPYRIPYDALLPKKSQLTNVLVPVAASMSHVRQNAVRMEPTWMVIGHASGVAAAMAAASGAAVQDVNVLQLQQTLLAQKQMIRP